MKKAVLIAPRATARELVPGPDLDRLLSSGSWLVVAVPKSRHPGTKKVAAFRQRKKENGFRYLHVLLSGEVINRLHAQKLDSTDTLAAVIERLLGHAGVDGG